MMLHIERQLEMEDVDDDEEEEDWEHMKNEDNMQNVEDMYSLLALKKKQNSCYSTGKVFWKQNFSFF